MEELWSFDSRVGVTILGRVSACICDHNRGEDYTRHWVFVTRMSEYAKREKTDVRTYTGMLSIALLNDLVDKMFIRLAHRSCARSAERMMTILFLCWHSEYDDSPQTLFFLQ